MSEGPQRVEHSEPVNPRTADNISSFEYSHELGESIEVKPPRWKRFFRDSSHLVMAAGIGGLTLATIGYLFVTSVMDKPPVVAAPQNLPPTKGITAIGTLPTETSVTGELVVKAPTATTSPTEKPATPTNQPATATPKKDSPTPAPKESTPTTTPAKPTPTPTEILQKPGEMTRINAKEITTPENFDKYFKPVSNENALGKGLKEQARFFFPDLEKPIVRYKGDLLTFSGSVTLRAPFEVKKILNEKEYQDLLSDYMNGRVPLETPINYIAYIVPGEGALAPVIQPRFIIGTINNKGRLEAQASIPLSALKATTFYHSVGDRAGNVDRLLRIEEYEGGKGAVSTFSASTIGFNIEWISIENERNEAVTFINDPASPYYAQEDGQTLVFMPPAVK